MEMLNVQRDSARLSHRAHLVWGVPEMDGVPIVAITAYGTDWQEKALAAGCVDCISKPVDFNSLEMIVERYLPSSDSLDGSTTSHI